MPTATKAKPVSGTSEQLLALLWWVTILDRLPAPTPPRKSLLDEAGRERRRIERDEENYRKRRAIQRCPDCDSDGWLDWSARGGIRFECPHDPALYREMHDAREAELQAAQEAWEIQHQQEAPRRDFTHVTDR